MVWWMRLEAEKYRWRPYHLAALASGAALLAFCYLMALIPVLDPMDGDASLFRSYDFLFMLQNCLSLAVFGILGAALGARLLVEAYTGKGALLLFSYPVARRSLLLAKLALVFGYTVAVMLVCGVLVEGLFLVSAWLVPLPQPVPTLLVCWQTLWTLGGYGFLAGCVAIGASWIGFLKKSVPLAMGAAVLMVTMLTQILSLCVSWQGALLLVAGIFGGGTCLVVRRWCAAIENMEV